MSDPDSGGEPPFRVPALPMALLFVLGGVALIFIGWVWGRPTPLDGVFAGSIIVVGATGILAGAWMLYRILTSR